MKYWEEHQEKELFKEKIRSGGVRKCKLRSRQRRNREESSKDQIERKIGWQQYQPIRRQRK